MTRGDLIVIAASALLVVGSFGWLWTPGAGGEWVEIQTGDGPAQRFSLWEPRHVDVRGSRGETRVDIEAGRARVVDSPCDDRICLLAGWLERVGDTTACLPNGVVVTIAGRAGTRFDAINF